MTYQLGIDLGTTYSAAAVRLDDRVEVVTLGSRSGAVPSAVVVREDGEMVFGETAAHRGMSEPERSISEFKRRVGDNRSIRVGGTEITPQTLMARYLAWMVDRVVERRGAPPSRIVLAHPANWGVHKLEALHAIVAESGIAAIPTGAADQPNDQPNDPGVVFVTEPVAAAVRYASEAKVETGAIIAVYDLGGGTFDATVMRKEATGFGVLGNPEGIEYLGGLDFDDALRHQVKLSLGEEYSRAEGQPGFASAYAALTRDVRDAKEALSTEDAITIGVLLPETVTSVDVQRSEYEAMIRPSIEESVAAMRRCLRNADVTPADIDHFLLVGGSSRTPLVGQLLEEAFGVPLQRDTDPKYAVAEGAALFTSLVQPANGVEPAPITPATAAPATAAPATAAPATAAPATAAPAAVTTTAATATPPPAPPAANEAPPNGSKPPGSRVTPAVLVGAGLALLVVLAGGFLLATNNSGDDATVAGGSTTDDDIVAVLGTNVEASTKVAGAGQLLAPDVPSAENMVEVGGGTYIIGLDDSDGHVPARDASVETFWIDAFEVTNAAYEPFVTRGDVDAPLGWNNGEVPAGLEAHPVFGVSVTDASHYCEAVAKRLPTETEWEIASRGGAARWYPWGNDPTAVETPLSGTHVVGSIPDAATPEGVHDLAGNVWELVSNPYDSVGQDEVVLRGGANGDIADAAFRNVGDSNDPTFMRQAGFRCAAATVDDRDPTNAAAVQELEAAGSTTTDGLLLDSFDNPASGWPVETGENYVRGYHPPDFYHVEAQGAEQRVLAPRGVNFANVEVSTLVLVDHTDTESGNFRYGLMVRAEGTDYHAFTINPRQRTWAVIHDDSLGFREVASGSTDDTYGITGRDRLTVRMDGSNLTFLLNDEELHQLDTGGYHLRGDIGFYVENFEETLAHVHYDEIVIRDL